MKDRDPIKDQHPEGLITVGILVLAVVLVGAVYALTSLFGAIFKL